MKLVTICIVYADRSGPPMNPDYPFIHSTQLAAESDEEIRRAAEALVKPILADGYAVLNQLFIVAPNDLVAKTAQAITTKEPEPPKRRYFGDPHQSEVTIESQEQR